jgi:hypothetical protein
MPLPLMRMAPYPVGPRATSLRKKLPHAGAYEFDRTCCNLLRQAIDATPGGQQTIAPPPLIEQGQSFQLSFVHDIPPTSEPSPAVSK